MGHGAAMTHRFRVRGHVAWDDREKPVSRPSPGLTSRGRIEGAGTARARHPALQVVSHGTSSRLSTVPRTGDMTSR